jgi:hypothetical protein
MMTNATLQDVAPYVHEQLRVSAAGEHEVVLEGEITVRDPNADIQPHLRLIHECVRGRIPALYVDVTRLHFVNSSAIRLFLDWTAWLRAELPEARYRLVFRTSASLTWQSAAFPAIQLLGGDLVTVERV